MEWFSCWQVVSDTWDQLKSEGAINDAVEAKGRRNLIRICPNSWLTYKTFHVVALTYVLSLISLTLHCSSSYFSSLYLHHSIFPSRISPPTHFPIWWNLTFHKVRLKCHHVCHIWPLLSRTESSHPVLNILWLVLSFKRFSNFISCVFILRFLEFINNLLILFPTQGPINIAPLVNSWNCGVVIRPNGLGRSRKRKTERATTSFKNGLPEQN